MCREACLRAHTFHHSSSTSSSETLSAGSHVMDCTQFLDDVTESATNKNVNLILDKLGHSFKCTKDFAMNHFWCTSKATIAREMKGGAYHVPCGKIIKWWSTPPMCKLLHQIASEWYPASDWNSPKNWWEEILVSKGWWYSTRVSCHSLPPGRTDLMVDIETSQKGPGLQYRTVVRVVHNQIWLSYHNVQLLAYSEEPICWSTKMNTKERK